MRVVACGLVAVSLVACARYERVYLQCERAPVAGTNTLGVTRSIRPDSSGPSILTGRVVDRLTRKPVDGVRLFWRDSSARTITEPTGAFLLDSIHPGRYPLVARRFGYLPRVDTLEIARAEYVVVDIPLDVAPLDGPCGGFAETYARKPWWKFW
jgi:hypothetical protein